MIRQSKPIAVSIYRHGFHFRVEVDSSPSQYRNASVSGPLQFFHKGFRRISMILGVFFADHKMLPFAVVRKKGRNQDVLVRPLGNGNVGNLLEGWCGSRGGWCCCWFVLVVQTEVGSSQTVLEPFGFPLVFFVCSKIVHSIWFCLFFLGRDYLWQRMDRRWQGPSIVVEDQRRLLSLLFFRRKRIASRKIFGV